jgi:ABC-type nitrate/sulfonate/bicarbonate transport system substrate-binding protein
MIFIFNGRLNNREVTIITTPELVKSVLNVIKEKNLLDEYLPENVEVNWINIDGTSNIRDALSTGQADIGPLGTIGYINAIEKQYPLYLISNSDNVALYLVSNSDSIKIVENLEKVRKIAVNSLGSSAHVALQIFAKENFGDYHYFDDNLLSPGQDVITNSILTSKDIDAAVINVNQYFLLKDRVTLLQRIDKDELPLSNYLVSNINFANNNRDIIEAFYRAEEKAINYLNNDSDEASEFLAPLYNLSSKQVLSELENNKRQISIINYDVISQTLYDLKLLEGKPRLYIDLPKYNELQK